MMEREEAAAFAAQSSLRPLGVAEGEAADSSSGGSAVASQPHARHKKAKPRKAKKASFAGRTEDDEGFASATGEFPPTLAPAPTFSVVEGATMEEVQRIVLLGQVNMMRVFDDALETKLDAKLSQVLNDTLDTKLTQWWERMSLNLGHPRLTALPATSSHGSNSGGSQTGREPASADPVRVSPGVVTPVTQPDSSGQSNPRSRRHQRGPEAVDPTTEDPMQKILALLKDMKEQSRPPQGTRSRKASSASSASLADAAVGRGKASQSDEAEGNDEAEDDEESDDEANLSDDSVNQTVRPRTTPSSRTRVILPAANLVAFEGDPKDREGAAIWLQKFEHMILSCDWDDPETVRHFKLNLSKNAKYWFKNLASLDKKTWAGVRKAFVKRFVKSLGSKAEEYFNMSQRPDEHIMTYMDRFNYAANQMNYKLKNHSEAMTDHVSRFWGSLHSKDERFKKVLMSRWPTTLADLEEVLRIELKIEENELRRDAKNKVSGASIPSGQRKTKPQVVPNAYAMEDDPDWTAELNAFAMTKGASGKRMCGECHREHAFVDGGCWAKLHCGLCNKSGHPESACFKACPLCKDKPHNKYDHCETRSQLNQLYEILARKDAEALSALPSLDFLKV